MIEHKSLIDNWSLQHAAIMLDNSYDITSLDDARFINSIGGLSNYINSILIYKDANYPENGFEEAWTNFEWFALNTTAYIKPLNTELTSINWHNQQSYDDNGIQNYLITSEYFNCDLFIAPERATIINSNINQFITENNFTCTLKKIDEEINIHRQSTWYDNVKVGISNNFLLPSLTHYVLSEATNADDLLTVIMQIKSSEKIDRIIEQITEITSSTDTAFKFQKDVEDLIKKNLNKPVSESKDWRVSVSALFLSISKAFNLDFFNRKEHLVFLKDIVKCRTEVNGLEKDLERIFKRKIQ